MQTIYHYIYVQLSETVLRHTLMVRGSILVARLPHKQRNTLFEVDCLIVYGLNMFVPQNLTFS